jgi:hypothetical protein
MNCNNLIQVTLLAVLAGSTSLIAIGNHANERSAVTLNDKQPNHSTQEETSDKSKPKFWTPARRAEYSKRRLDSSLWNSEYLDMDVEVREKFPWPTKAALEGIPSPVPQYPNDFGGAVMVPNLKIGNRDIKGTIVAWGKSDVNRHLFPNDTDDLLIYLNIFILTDTPKIENGKNAIVSRNWPHILSTGKQKTSIGNVDWVHVAFANDDNYAFISQRIFDLKFGNTIFVAPQKDGTLRFLQFNGPKSILHEDRVEHINEYSAQLKKDDRVIQFIDNEKTVGGEAKSDSSVN